MIRPLLFAMLALPTSAGAFFAGATLGPIRISEDRNVANLAVAPASEMVVDPIELGEPRVLRRGGDGLFRVTANVRGTPVRFIVDTGATTMVLTARDAARIGIDGDTYGSADVMQTAGGASPMRWTRIARVEIAGHAVKGVDAAVVEGGLKHSLLGQNVLSKLGEITFSGDRLTISPPKPVRR